MHGAFQGLKYWRYIKVDRVYPLMMAVLLLAGCTTAGASPSAIPTTVLPTPSSLPVPTDTNTPPEKATELPTTQSSPLNLAIVPLSSTSIEKYGLLELDIKTTLQAANPYDPNEIEIMVRFSAPSGKELQVGAFWYQDYDLVTRLPRGEPGWKVRFTPTEIGTWSAVAMVPSKGLESGAISFQVVESDKHGFVRVNPTNPRYFAFDDGSFFFPIGLNMAWWSGVGDALTDYKKWMDPLAANGGNIIRVWMAEWSFGIEWNDTPLGNYDHRLRKAWLLDQIFKMAAERGMFIDLVLLNCADFNNWQTNGWNGNPYNAAWGGPLESPDQFVTDPTARALLQRRLNYIVNRWGYAPQMLAWEWWNEVNLAPFGDKKLIPWLEEMTAYVRARDINQHLITNSYAIQDLSPIWELPEMDIIQKHEYAHQVASPNKDMAERVVADFTKLAMSAPAKPILLGEFGYGTEGYGNDIDKTGIHLHNGLWATTFAGYAASGMYWYWDVYVEAYRAWYHFKGLADFLDGVDLTRYQPFSPLDVKGPGSSMAGAFGMGLRGEDTLVWIRSNGYTVQAAELAASGKPGYFVYQPPEVKGLSLALNEMEDGEYTVSWYNPQNAQWIVVMLATAQNGTLTLPIPSFRADLAAKIVRNQ